MTKTTLRPGTMLLCAALLALCAPRARAFEQAAAPQPIELSEGTPGFPAHATVAPLSWNPRAKRHVAKLDLKQRGAARSTSITNTPMGPLADTYVQDGTGPVVVVDPLNPMDVFVAFNEGWDFDPDIPLSTSWQGGASWTSVQFPPGTGIYAGYPHTPWAQPGNDDQEYYASLVREDLYPTDNTHTIITRSGDSGANFGVFYEIPNDVRQDRSMFDIDRTSGRGGTTGAHDGKLYVCYDDWGDGGPAYASSWLKVLSPEGGLLVATPLSTVAQFKGSQFQPVAGTLDGQLLLASMSLTNGGATVNATFFEAVNGGATVSGPRATLSWAPAGQRLGTSNLRGVNGFKIDEHGYLDIDRSNGPRRSYLYFITNRNPNPTNAALDQGDLWLSVSVDRGASWTSKKIPTDVNVTQYFPMLDVDDQGWIHVAYYENASGFPNDGVLTADHARLRYTVSRDGGVSWTPAAFVNGGNSALSFEDPPLDWGAYDYDVLGDYQRLQAAGTGDNTVAFVSWTGYDMNRTDDGVGTKKQRVYLTRLVTPPAPGPSAGALSLLAAGLLAAAAATLARRLRTQPAPVTND